MLHSAIGDTSFVSLNLFLRGTVNRLFSVLRFANYGGRESRTAIPPNATLPHSALLSDAYNPQHIRDHT